MNITKEQLRKLEQAKQTFKIHKSLLNWLFSSTAVYTTWRQHISLM